MTDRPGARPRHLRLMTLIAIAVALLVLVLPTRKLTAPPPDGVEMQDLTWVETRAARTAGVATVIVPTGATGTQGPDMTLGARSGQMRATAQRYARERGGTLVAPVFPYGAAPRDDPAGKSGGDPTGALIDIALPAPVFAGVLEGAARSLKAAGFTSIIFLAADEVSRQTQIDVARRLSRRWAGDGVQVSAETAAPRTRSPVEARADTAPARVAGAPDGSAPLPGDTVELASMTPLALHAARAAGFFTVIVPTGGLEQNGPHMILGKHDYLVAHAARRIARAVGRTLVAPVIPFVPEGDHDPPTGHLRFPGTIGVPEGVLAGVLEGVARRLKTAGFTTIVFIGDHGQSQPAQAEVAARLSREWTSAGVHVVQIASYYTAPEQAETLRREGFSTAEIGQHASVVDTSEMLAVHPSGVDLTRYRPPSFWLEDTGVSGDPTRSRAALGERLIRMRIDTAVREITASRTGDGAD
jgi:creatinine amidohydrolase